MGGGICIAVHKSFKSFEILCPYRNIEFLAIKLSWRSKSLFLYAAYIPPNSKSDVYKMHSQNINFLSSLSNVKDIICVLGDFNLPKIDWIPDEPAEKFLYPTNINTEDDQSFLDAMQSMNLYQICNISNLNRRFLDLVFMNDLGFTSITKSLMPFVPERLHHFGLELCLDSSELFCKFSNKNKSLWNYNYKKADVSNLTNFLDSTDWNNVLGPESCDVNESVDKFYSIMFNAFDKFIPKYLKKETNRPPWFNKTLSNLRNRKNRAHRLMKIFQNDTNLKHDFRKLRKEFDKLNRIAYNKYICSVENNLINDPQNFWKFVNLKRKTSGYPVTMFYNDVEASNDLNICDLFAEFFQCGYKDLQNDISTETTYNSHQSNCISLPIITEDDIWNGIVKLKHGCGSDSIPSSILKSCATSLLLPLSIIFNNSLKQG
ncbi:MAG TPA: hypothetical protein DDZ41_03675, partial [Flavobacterium sp.]|nr:hypothetical protein [Flavobacterium sp.]